ncbi:MAG TPA: DUF1800 domain-containing protein [Pyrinomonadaceae bacterium]|jgi:uncharacterized protein (DUF1800 family)|nr:DUF1800 domain-containing protein [Pyrinomonadaceae bacterium]
MKAFFSSRRRTLARSFALLCASALLANSLFAAAAAAQTVAAKQSAAQKLTEEQRVVHVLNRLGFGARPGDVERVEKIGLKNYIEQQLNPQAIDDSALEAKLRSYPTLQLTTGELLARYPQPNQLLRRLQREGKLPPELASLLQQQQARQQTQQSQAQGQQQDDKLMTPAPQANRQANPNAVNPDAERLIGEAQNAQLNPQAAKQQAQDADPQRRAYRQAIMEYMRENGLENPQRIMSELDSSRVIRAVYSERQLQEVMVNFWENHFNIYAQKGADRWFLTSYDRDVIRPNALGNFRDLLEATAKSPAMLFYLDNFQSVSPNAQANRAMFRRQQADIGVGPMRAGGLFGGARMRDGEARARMQAEVARQGQNAQRPQQQNRPKRGINENYARELMELHTMGVDGGYTQKDVQEVARAFTGWTIYQPRGGGIYGDDAGQDSRAGTFYFNSRTHDEGEKVVLGQKIPGGGGMEDGEKVLDILVAQPATAKFIATKLCRYFVSDDPSPALVARVADAFHKSNGDIKTTLRAIFYSPEFNSTDARRAKIKTPFELAVSSIRTLGADTDARPALVQWISKMGEPLYGYIAPTGYPDVATYWVNTGALLERLNFSLALVSNRIPGTRVDLSKFVGEDASSSRAVDQKGIVDRFLDVVLQGDISPKSREVLMKQLTDQSDAPVASMPDDSARAKNVAAARREQQAGGTVGNPEVARIAALIIGSPEFQRQ